MPERSELMLAYAAEGDGPPMVALHAGGANRRQWRQLAARFMSDWRVVAPDLFGHGATGRLPADVPRTLDNCAKAVAPLVGTAPRETVLIGHSGGGVLAVTYAMMDQSRLRALVLIEPTLCHILREVGDPTWNEAESLGRRHIEVLEREGAAAAADIFLPYWIGQESWDSMPEEQREMIVETMPGVVDFWRAHFAETTPLSTYGRLRLPVLLIRGRHSVPWTRRIVDLLAGEMPNCEVVELDAGHMSPLTHPEAVNDAIAGFLDNVDTLAPA